MTQIRTAGNRNPDFLQTKAACPPTLPAVQSVMRQTGRQTVRQTIRKDVRSPTHPVAHSSGRPVARSSGRPLIQSSGRPSGRRSFIKWRRMPILALAAIGRLAGQPSHQPACHRSRSATGSPTGRPHILQDPSFPPPITDRGDGFYIKNFTKIGVFSCNSKKNSKNSG